MPRSRNHLTKRRTEASKLRLSGSTVMLAPKHSVWTLAQTSAMNPAFEEEGKQARRPVGWRRRLAERPVAWRMSTEEAGRYEGACEAQVQELSGVGWELD